MNVIFSSFRLSPRRNPTRPPERSGNTRSIILIAITWCIACFNFNSYAQTVSGVLESDENWSGTVVLEGDVSVPAGVTLTIAPGTIIKCQPLQDTSQSSYTGHVELLVDGGILVAAGTSQAPVQFLSNADIPEPGDWGGIQVNDGNVTLKHFVISDAYTALRFNDSDNRFNEYDISDGVISRSRASGLWLNGEGDNVRSILFNRLTIQDTLTDPDSNPEPEGAGIFLEGPAELVDCKILRSARAGVHLDNSDPDVVLTRCEIMESGSDGVFNDDNGALVMTECIVAESNGQGIHSDTGSLLLDACSIRDNAGGVLCDPWNANSVTIRNCTIDNNRGDDQGDGIRIGSGNDGCVITIEGNTIRNNAWNGIELDTRNSDIAISIGGNVITQNHVGVIYRDRLDRILTISGNHIADNVRSEVHNENNWPIVADGNSWGSGLAAELTQRIWNPAGIHDVRDDWYAGQVLIREWYPLDATGDSPGTLQTFSYERPGITQVVSGDITEQVVWSGNILVTGDVVIQPGGVLIIDAGTTVQFEPLRDTRNTYWHSRSEIVLEGGSLIAEGTAERPILFTSASPDFRPQEDWIGDWRGFSFNDGDFALKHFQVEFAVYSMDFNDTDTRFNSYEMANGVIRDSRITGMVFDSTAERTQLTTLNNITIQDTHVDPEWNTILNGKGIYAKSPVELVECLITRSARDGIHATERAGIHLINSQLIANGGDGIHCQGNSVQIEGSVISDSGVHGIEMDWGSLTMTESRIHNNAETGIHATPSTNHDFDVTYSEITENGDGIYYYGGWVNTDITIAYNSVLNNTRDGIRLDPGNSNELRFTDTGIRGNLISGNNVGIRYEDGLDRALQLHQNHIADNSSFEVYNQNNWPIVADGNSWGQETTGELQDSRLNLTRIHDSRDNVDVGQVLIRDFYPTSALADDLGTPQPFDYSRPGLGRVVSGPVEESQTWSGHVLVTGDVFIQPSVTLTIAPGTLVEFELLRDTNVSGWWLSRSELIVNGGNLVANGTPENPVVFTTSSPDTRSPEDYPGDWLGIRLEDGNMELTHFEILYATYGIVFNDDDNRFSEITVTDGLISRSNRGGVWFRGEGVNVQPITVSRLVIEDSEKVDNNNWGHAVLAEGPAVLNRIKAHRSERHGIAVVGASVEINNSMVRVSGDAGVFVREGSVVIDDSLITLNEDSGIYADRSSVTILDSEITENLEWGANIDNRQQNHAVTFSNNIFQRNKHGFSIAYSSGEAAPLSLVKNTVVDNTTHGIVLESNSSSVTPDEFEFSENTIAYNENGLISQYRSGTLNIFDNDIFDNRVLDIKTERDGGIRVVDSYLGETTTAEIASGQENLTLIFDQMDSSNSGPVVIEGLRTSSRQTAPGFRITPESASTEIGGSAVFYALAEGTPLITYQWYLDGEAISRATNSLHRVSLVTSGKLGQYHVVATSPHGSATSPTATLTLDLPDTLPSITVQPQSISVAAGDSFFLTVTAEGTPPLSYQWYKNDTAIPGAVSQVFNVAGAQESDAGAYRVSVSNSAGSVTSDIAVVMVEGGSSHDSVTYHPADENRDSLVTISEVTAYGAAWRQGDQWPVGPDPVPIAYVTRAGALWQGGESYTRDEAIQNPPLWWVNSTPQPQLLSLRALDSGSHGRVSRSLVQSAMNLKVAPSSSTRSYAVEESLPEGLTPSGISDGGVYDSDAHQVRWGPFFDNQPRTLTYYLHADDPLRLVPTISGTASFDGNDLGIENPYSSSNNPLEGRQLSINMGANGKPFLVVNGETGQIYVIEAAPDITGANWTIVAEIKLSRPSLVWEEPDSVSDQHRFFRIRKQ